MGVRRDLKARHLVPEFRGNYPIAHLGHSNLGPERRLRGGGRRNALGRLRLHRGRHDALRRNAARGGGTLDGVRMISRALVECATHDLDRRQAERLLRGRHSRGRRHRSARESRSRVFRCAARRWAPRCSARWPRPAPLARTAPARRSSGSIRQRDISFVGLMTGLMTTVDNSDALAAALRHRARRCLVGARWPPTRSSTTSSSAPAPPAACSPAAWRRTRRCGSACSRPAGATALRSSAPPRWSPRRSPRSA